MLHNSHGDSLGFSFLEKIFPAHESLQLRELAHHLTHQIVLAEMCGPEGVCGDWIWKSKGIDQISGDAFDPVATITEAAEADGVGDAVKFVPTGAARLTPIHLEKEFRIRQPCAQHTFVAADDQ